MNNRKTLIAGSIAGALSLPILLSACGGGGGGGGSSATQPPATSSTVDDVVTTNADIGYAAYRDSLLTAQALRAAIDTFVAIVSPTEQDLQTVKQAWLDAREPYGQTEVYRFRLGPIDSTNGVDEDGPEGQINGWPLGEAIIDYVVAPPTDGDENDSGGGNGTYFGSIANNIIADASITLDAATIAAFNEIGDDERNVVTGYHAIEFLLWGQDLNQGQTVWNSPPRDPSGGQRPVSDFEMSGTGSCTSGAVVNGSDVPCQRRKDYLQAVTQLLVEDLQAVVAAWDPNGAGNHYQTFVAGGNTSLAKMLESMGRLGFGELAGERIAIALQNDSQEDEHSCFSDNTHRDIFLNERGIANTFFGSYTSPVDPANSVDGTGIDDYLNDQGLTGVVTALTSSINAAVAAAQIVSDKAASGTPFDNQIASDGNGGSVANRADVQAVIDALVAQTIGVQNVVTGLGLTTDDLLQDTECDLSGPVPVCP